MRAAESKKAIQLTVLDLREITSFTDFFVICTGNNAKQIQTIADEVALKLKEEGERATSIEGFENAEWILMDYGDMIVHVFSEQARAYYELERLWRDAKVVAIPAESLATP